MSRLVASHVALQTTAQSVPATPAWFGEVAVIAHHLTRQGVLREVAQLMAMVTRNLCMHLGRRFLGWDAYSYSWS